MYFQQLILHMQHVSTDLGNLQALYHYIFEVYESEIIVF
jgi:hypothetical protein